MTFPKERCELSGVTCGYWVTYYKNLAERQGIELSHCAKRIHEQREEIKRLATIPPRAPEERAVSAWVRLGRWLMPDADES